MMSESNRSMTTVRTDTSNFSPSSLREEDQHLARKLILTLNHDQLLDEKNLEDIVKRFSIFGFTVKVHKDNHKPGTFVVLFASKDAKMRAHKLKQKLGYKLVKKRRARPSPKKPVLFLACCDLDIKTGKAKSNPVVGYVKKDELVLVDSIKSNRARLQNINNGDSRGWVELVSRATGEELLKRVKLTDQSFPIEKFFEPRGKCVEKALIELQRSNYLKSVKKM